jgi:hypothetical protein
MAEPPDTRSGSGFFTELEESVQPRTVILIAGVLLMQLGFILSYVGAFHAPTPSGVPVAVVAPAQVIGQLANQLNALPSHPLEVTALIDMQDAQRRVRNGDLSAALIVNPSGTQDQLLVASGGGASLVTAVEQVITQVESNRVRTVSIDDVVPLQAGDARGLTGFYLVIGWIVGGLQLAVLLGITKGARPSTINRAAYRLLAAVLYAILSGLGGALIVDQFLGALTGHFVALWWLGALVVFAAAAVTMAFQVLLGIVGIGLALLVFIVLGNPSAGGAYQPALLPPFWRAISGALPNGAATDSVRRIVYFGAQGITTQLIVLAAYAGGGVIVSFIAGAVMRAARRA